jgi:restriction system protein
MTVWGVHSDQPQIDQVAQGFVAIGWDDIGDLSAISTEKEALKEHLAQARLWAKPGAIPVWAGVLLRFRFEMQIGDLVIYPFKPDSTLNFGRITSDYYYEPSAEQHRNRRKVEWLKTGVPRAEFSKQARYEIGSAVTLFRVKTHDQEFIDYVEGAPTTMAAPAEAAASVSVDEAAAQAEEEPNAERIEEYTRDFVIETLFKELDGPRFEHFVGDLMKAMGYRAQVTQVRGDGGVDVVAFRDPLGLEPPIIKVQCKRVVKSIGAPDVQNLTGALAPGGSEVGLFITLGSFSKDAVHIGRTRQDLRLVNGNEFVDLVLEHYEKLGSEWKRMLPLRSLYVVDREPEAG